MRGAGELTPAKVTASAESSSAEPSESQPALAQHDDSALTDITASSDSDALNKSNALPADDIPAPQSDDDTSTATAGSTTIRNTGQIILSSPLTRNNVATITFSNTIDVPADATIIWNAATDGSAGVTAWAVPSTTTSDKYDVTYASDGVYPSFPSNSGDLFNGFQSLTSLTNLDKIDTSNVTTMGNMFQNCSSLTTLDVSGFDTSNVTNMNSMFQYCSSLTTLDTSNWNTSNVTTMSYMFNRCSSLTTLDTSNWNTSNVTNMNSMFQNCSSLTTLDVSGFDTSNVTTMGNMFYNCSKLTTLDTSNWNTSNVTNMGSMFCNCSKLTTLDTSNWNTSNVTNMNSMFQNCSSLTTLDVSNWNTSNVTNMGNMFYNCSKLTTLDVSNWNTSNVTNMGYMFNHCNKLSELTLGSQFTFNGATSSRQNVALGQPNSPAKTGYTATNKWMNKATGTVYDSPTDIPNGDSLEPAGATSATYVPYYIPNTYTIRFVSGASDATGTMDDEVFSYGTEQALTLNAFERIGYDFAGWKDANGTTYTDGELIENLTATNNAVILLTAQWTAAQYQITYDLDGGTLSEANPDHYTYGEGVDSFNAPTKEGWVFTGWRDDDGNTITSISKTDTGAKHLTAQWGLMDLPKTGGSMTPSSLETCGVVMALLAGLALVGMARSSRRRM